MAKTSKYSAEPYLPPASRNLASLASAAEKCEGCPLFAAATQTVFGEGPQSAHLVFVGEQPGEVEDRDGRPFVGPAGKLFSKLLAEVGIDRESVYVTNAVKHFKWKPSGKRRLHAKPSSREIHACQPWLVAELAAIEPEMLVLLGATAAQSLLGNAFRLTAHRGEVLNTPWAKWTLATLHPSAILRAMQLEGGEEMLQSFKADLRAVSKKLRQLG